MKQEECKKDIIKLFLVQLPEGQRNGENAFGFFLKLDKEKSPLLNFSFHKGDKWQLVNGWLHDLYD